MSTIKSSAEDLTINADGSNEIKFQINAVEKASINSSGLLTSTTIDATALTGNLPAISGASLTGITTGKVLQVVHSSTDFDTSSSSNVELYTASITPSATSSKVLILFSCAMQIDNGEYAKLSIYRGSLASGSAVFTLDDVGFLQSEPGGMHRSQSTGHFLDSPSTTSSQQYSIVGVNIGGVTMRYGAGANNPITLMEIGA